MIDVEILSNDFIKVSSEVVADSVKYQKVKFSFPEHWTGALKTAVFSNGDIVKNVILNSDSPMYVSDDIYYIPHEVIKAPGFTISVFGILNDTVLTSDNGVVRVRESGMLEGEVPSKPTPSEYQQLIELAKNAESIAQSVRDDADNGKFKGDKGDPAVTDQTYAPTSENAQSGKAVAEAVAIEQKRSDNTFANALKGTKSDTAMLLDDISPVTHEMSVKISSDTVTDLTAVKVTRCGKNLIQTNIIEVTSPESVENLIWQGHISGKLSFSLDNSEYTPNPSNVNSANFKFVFGDGTVKYSAAYGSHIYLNTSSPLKEIYFLNWGKGTGVIKNIQLEIGSSETDYEPYVEPTYYTPNADGTVNGVTSLYPHTTLMTDTEGVTITCEYNKDINKLNDWVLIAKGEITEEVFGFIIDKDINGNDFELSEFHLRTKLLSSNGNNSSVIFRINKRACSGVPTCLMNSSFYANENATHVTSFDGKEMSISEPAFSAGGIGVKKCWTNPFIGAIFKDVTQPITVNSVQVSRINSSSPHIAEGTYELWGRYAK